MKYFPMLFVAVAIALAAYFVFVATTRSPTPLEGTLLQFLILLAGLAGSFMVGRQAADKAAREIIRPHARSSYRRIRALFQGLSRVSGTIESAKQNKTVGEYQVTLASIEASVAEQLVSADDAMKDWLDVAPDDLEDLITAEHSGDDLGDANVGDD